MPKKKKIDWVPQEKYGRLTVLSKTPTKKGEYRCECECGNIAYRKSDELRFKVWVNKCSAYCDSRLEKKKRAEREAQHPSAYAENIYQLYEKRASEKHREFDIPFHIFEEMLFQECYYCGKLPSVSHKRNGIDRIDSAKGYTLDNVVTSCFPCNQLKSSHTEKYLEKMANFYRKIQEFKSK